MNILKVAKKIFYIAFALLLFGINVQGQTTFFVSPKGNDTKRRTQVKPFASIPVHRRKSRIFLL
jgi:hypothetical protein